MLTTRGFWFLVLTLTVGGIGGAMTLRGSGTLLTVALAALLWFGVEWMLFYCRAKLVAKGLNVNRTIADNRGPVSTLWVGQTYHVSVNIALQRGRLTYAAMDDRPPVGGQITSGEMRFAGPVTPTTTAGWEYTVRCERLGALRFEGVRLRLADLQGFFFAELFLRHPLELPVLPAVAGNESQRRGDKRVNLLPPPGVHRHRRPGTGSELLELRDYRPGDPPKRIAWKVSARRDTLITREYESEVPLRCTLLIDAGAATRVGPPGMTPLAKFCDIAATVARTAISNRDLVGLAICDEQGVEYRPPARTSAHLVALLEILARVARAQAHVATDEVNSLLPRAYALALELYPELMHSAVNKFPSWLPWLAPQPVYLQRPGRRPVWSVFRTLRQITSAAARRRFARRKQLAALLAAKYALPPGSVGLMLDEDLAMACWLQRFLAEHRVPYPVSQRDTHGRDLLNDPTPLTHQSRALTRAVSRGRDNELYVLMGDYVRRSDDLMDSLKAARVARAKHHQILVVQPGSAPDDPGPTPTQAHPDQLIRYAQKLKADRQWSEVRRSFGRMGIPVLPAETSGPVRLILHRLEQMRMIQVVGRR